MCRRRPCVGAITRSGQARLAFAAANRLGRGTRDIGMPELVARLSAEKKGQGHHDVAGPGAAWRTLQI